MTALRLIVLLSLCWCTMPGQAQTSGAFSFEGTNRTYLVYAPASLPSGQAVPLVFVLHGFTQNGSAIMNISGFNNVADANGFIVVYPDGIGNAWNTNNPFPGSSTANDVGFLSALIDTVSAHYNINPNRVYSCGFSAGGFMSHKLACELSNRVAAVAAVSGTMTSGALALCQPQRPVPVLQIHGTADGVVAYNGSFANLPVEQIVGYWADKDTCPTLADTTALPDLNTSDGSTVQRITYHPCSQNTTVELLKITDGGHAWPSGNGFAGLGNVNRDINASTEIWAFFSQFNLQGNTVGTTEAATSAFVVYPNPVIDVLRIASQHPATWMLFDFNGRLLGKGDGDRVDLASLPAGVYFCRIDNGKQPGIYRVVKL